MKAIVTKYIPPSETKPSRIKASIEKHSLTIEFAKLENEIITLTNSNSTPHIERVHAEAAIRLAKKLNWEGKLVCGGIDGAYVFVFLSDIIYEID